ncbi:ABC transporter permease subunit [Thermococcus sp. 21S7]|uniref:ABC transporter permease n=1 Tax=Thermococcus sp. 21S7 TaxID=1638221 RepID=UPI001439F298|nr:ABC transporter permease subunit [Thermococcus sp. 21S7]NJE62516.1 ABC transporter permease [Thermococcus sp. 21S7]
MIGAIAGKEFRDYLTSKRFIVLFAFLLGVTLLALVQVKVGMTTWQGISIEIGKENLKVYQVMGGVTYYLSLIGGIFALALGFDAITRERENRTLKVLMSHPVYRDQVILGKLLGGAMTLAVAVIVTFLIVLGTLMGLGITVDGTAVIRLAVYFLFAYIYLMVFFAMAVAFSTRSSSSGNALMYSLVLFLVLTLVINAIAPIVADHVAGPKPQPPQEAFVDYSGNVTLEELQAQEKLWQEYDERIQEWSKRYFGTIDKINSLSPTSGFQQIAQYVLNPHARSLEDMFSAVLGYGTTEEEPNYTLAESLSFAKREIAFLIAYVVITFIAAYLGFVRAEIR